MKQWDGLQGCSRRTIFAFWVHLDEDLLGAHDLDDLTDIGARLLQQAELFSQESHAGVVVVALGFESAESGLTLEDLEFHRLDLVVVVLVERHLGRSSRRGSKGEGDVMLGIRQKRIGIVCDWARGERRETGDGVRNW